MPNIRLLLSVITLGGVASATLNLPAQIMSAEDLPVFAGRRGGLSEGGFGVGLVFGPSGTDPGGARPKLEQPAGFYSAGNGRLTALDFPARIGASPAVAAVIPETRSFAAVLAFASAVFVLVRRRPARVPDRDEVRGREAGGGLFTQT